MYPQKSIRVAVAETRLHPLQEWQAWVGETERQIATAVNAGAEVIVLPAWGTLGLATSGTQAERYAAIASHLDRFVEQMRELARSHVRYLVAPGLPVSISEGRYRHRVHLFAPNGALAFQDQLLVTAAQSEEGLDAGEQLKCFDTELGRLAILVAGDIQHPALARAASESGAWLIINPCCDSEPGEATINRNAAAVRAQESGCFVAQAVCAGHLAGHDYQGEARVTLPPVAAIAEDGVMAGERSGGWLITDLDALQLQRLKTDEAAEHVCVIDLERPRVVVEESLM